MKFKAELLDSAAVERTIIRMAHQIVEKNGDAPVCLVGIKTRGVPLARRLQKAILDITGREPMLGSLDITLYRDDLSTERDFASVQGADIPFPVRGQIVVLCDDVLYTGRTARAAIEAVFEAGRPAKLQLCVLCDRGHRELPIRADFVGKNIPTSKNEVVAVRLIEHDGDTAVLLYEKL